MNSVENGERHQDHRADQRGYPDHDMEGEADCEIERQPWQIEQRARPHAGQERPDVVEITQRLQPFAATAGHQRQADHGLEHPATQAFVERGADADQDTAPDQFKDALGGIQATRENHERDQRRHAAARQHPVVHLQHEERAGEVEQVDHGNSSGRRRQRRHGRRPARR